MNSKQNLPVIGNLYRHFKGGLYTVAGFAEHTETGETLVIYDGVWPVRRWARPLSMWNETVEHDGKTVPRFSPAELNAETLEDLWDLLTDVMFDEDENGELILAEPYYFFHEGTSREEIWYYFDDLHPKGVHYLLYERENES